VRGVVCSGRRRGAGHRARGRILRSFEQALEQSRWFQRCCDPRLPILARPGSCPDSVHPLEVLRGCESPLPRLRRDALVVSHRPSAHSGIIPSFGRHAGRWVAMRGRTGLSKSCRNLTGRSLRAPMSLESGGAEGRDRTGDLTITNRLLYQLSYLGFALYPTCPIGPFQFQSSHVAHPLPEGTVVPELPPGRQPRQKASGCKRRTSG
jgi:hypothetical protein